MEGVTLLKGGAHTDARGQIAFVNDFQFPGVKRFYQITHPDTSVVRAWQGHQVEHKYFYVVKGSFAVAWVQPDDWSKPSAMLPAFYETLNAGHPAVLSVPPGFANGIKALEKDSVLLVYSNLTLEQSAEDRWQFDAGLWLDWNNI
ncbi:hypothetical protein DCC81_18680 [Chitinophaga parva]|uniref:Sugar 3,4-ketoisomerase QdtA cupin domain-containing protein n=1 Tax=Chitinophaga parva TaxID=2169414 RepID=A0A2T7BIZ0_9BACT|nr:dTDP-4-dehydrorhamnose 3,5-epimerase family protein [Chitinophaga parva]PUZ26251.1 hypothetical protein DCC81_18680 [Chitinophaga parva]